MKAKIVVLKTIDKLPANEQSIYFNLHPHL